MDLADRASSRDAASLPDLMKALDDPHPVILWWGAVGCLVLREKASPAKAKLLAALGDDWADVRIAAAEALGYLGETERAIEALEGVLAKAEPYEKLAALNALDFMTEARQIPLARAQALVRDLKLQEPADRIPRYLLGLRP